MVKRKALLALAVSGLFGILGVPLGAQSAPNHRFNIPFEFAVNGKTMPAGEYRVSFSENSPFVQIQSVGGNESLRFMTYAAATTGLGDQAKVTFHRYGNQYFLAQTSVGAGSSMRGFVMSRAEREAVQAVSSNSVQTVTIAAVR